MRLLVGFHGYAQTAEDMLTELEQVPGSGKWTLLSVQALHRFYARGEKVVACWMTRQDRELAIADNIAYVDRAVGTVVNGAGQVPIVYLGFSQGVAMAYRAGILGAHRAEYVIAVGGDVPPDVKTAPGERFPSILVAAGQSDDFYGPSKVDADETFLRSTLGAKATSARIDVFRYPGGHEFTAEVRRRIGQALESLIRQ